MKKILMQSIKILMCIVFIVGGASFAYTVKCVTRNAHGKRFRYTSTYPYVKRKFKTRTARYALRSCRRKSRWPRSCRLVGCRGYVARYRCYSYYRYAGRVRRFYQVGVNRRNGRYRSMVSCSRNQFRRRYGLACYFGSCRRVGV